MKRMTNLLQKIINSLGDENTLIADGFEDAVLGIDTISNRVIYSVTKCIEVLVSQGMDYEEAFEYFDYNVKGAYMGELTPIWCEDDF